MKSDYSKYRFNDFLEDDAFLDFVMHPTPEKSTYWDKVIGQHPGLKEDFDAAMDCLTAIRYKKLTPRRGSKEQVWDRISRGVAIKDVTPGSSPLRRLWPYLAAAASVMLIAVYVVFLRTDIVTEKAAVAQTRMIKLPDSSYITLNAGTEVSYDRLTYDKKRVVHLKGEAYFQVRKGNEFTVETERGRVRVLGTTFNVYCRGDLMNVSCLVGKVGVIFAQAAREYILTSGMQVSNEGQQVRSLIFDVESFKSWREGYFYYDNAPLMQVVEELQRQYNIRDLKYSNNVLKYRYSGFFTKDNLPDALQSVFLPLKLRADIQNGVLSIKENQ